MGKKMVAVVHQLGAEPASDADRVAPTILVVLNGKPGPVHKVRLQCVLVALETLRDDPDRAPHLVARHPKANVVDTFVSIYMHVHPEFEPPGIHVSTDG